MSDAATTVRWLCPKCGWSVADENSAGDDQPCEAYLDGDGEYVCDGVTSAVTYVRAGMTTEDAWEAINDLGLDAVFMDQEDYERRTDALMAIVAADPTEHGAAVALWRLSHERRKDSSC